MNVHPPGKKTGLVDKAWQTSVRWYARALILPLVSGLVPTVELVETGLRTATGFSSGAYYCFGADGRHYYVKSPRQAGALAVVAEWLCACLAQEMEMPAQEGALVRVPETLAACAPAELGSGVAFGSVALPQAEDLSFGQAVKLPVSVRAEILMFDYWVHNEDRALGPAGGKPNLLVAKGHPVRMIDHGNAFDPAWDARNFTSGHAFASSAVFWRKAAQRQRWMNRALRCLDQVPAFWEAMPRGWHENTYGEPLHHLTLENVLHLLYQFRDDEPGFWAPFLTS